MKNLFNLTWRGMIACFVAGVLAILPLAITVAVVAWVAGFIQGVIGPETFLGGQLRSLGLMFASDKVVAYLLGWVFVLAFVLLLGIIVRLGMQNLLQQGMEGIIRRIPLLGSLYQTAQQLVGMVKTDESDLKRMGVVFCLFGGELGAGILALMPSPERFHINGIDYHIVIIPTAPVPVGGVLLFVPCGLVHRAAMSVDGLMSIYVSMGVTTPQYLNKPESDQTQAGKDSDA